MQLARHGNRIDKCGARRDRISWRRAHRIDPRRFGRGRGWQLSQVTVRPSWEQDLKLFATTFLAGFLFVSVLLA
ncbi:MAG: hypothetical protein ACJ8ET_05650 [Sphingomicrobium sp.]